MTGGAVLKRLLSGSSGKCNILLYGAPGTGKTSFFERMFKTTLTEGEFEELKTLGNLAPGDFRTVRQEAFYLDEETSNADLIAALRAECLLKKDGDTKSRIGFAA